MKVKTISPTVLSTLTVYLFVMLLSVNPLRGNDFEIFINGGFAGDSTFTSTNYQFSSGLLNRLRIEHMGSIEGSWNKNAAAFGLGVAYFFNRHLGVSLSGEFTQRSLPITSQYTVDYTWITSNLLPGSTSRDFTLKSKGVNTLIPLNLNVIYRITPGEKTFINLSAGITLCLYNMEFSAFYGAASMQEINYLNEDWEVIGSRIFLDYWALEVEVKREKTYVLGANFSLDVERKITRWLGVYAGGKYTYLPEMEYKWQIVADQEFDGLDDVMSFVGIPDIHDEGEDEKITHNNISFFRIYVGAKIYL